MKTSITLQDVLSDIEIELVQGAVSRDDLGQSLQSVRQFQHKLRSELLAERSAQPNDRELIKRQFQINDLLLSLLQETIAKVQTLQLELRKGLQLTQSAKHFAPFPGSQPEQNGVENSLSARDREPAVAVWAAQAVQHTAEIKAAMREDELKLTMDVRPINLPVVGWFFTRLRSAVHALTLFYVNRLATRQTAVNRLYGDWLLHAQQVNQTQQEQIALLNEQVAALRARLQQLES